MLQSRRAAAGIVVLSLMPLGAACHGKSSSPTATNRASPSPQRYVSVVCSAVLDWKNVIEVRSSSLVTQDPSVRRATDYLTGVLQDTDQMVAQIRAVGAPTAPNSPSLQRDVVLGLAAARSALVQVQPEVIRLVAQGTSAFSREVELPILSTIEALESELRNPSIVEISQATASDTDCNTLFRRKAPVGIGA